MQLSLLIHPQSAPATKSSTQETELGMTSEVHDRRFNPRAACTSSCPVEDRQMSSVIAPGSHHSATSLNTYLNFGLNLLPRCLNPFNCGHTAQLLAWDPENWLSPTLDRRFLCADYCSVGSHTTLPHPNSCFLLP